MTKEIKVCIIKIGNETTNVVAVIDNNTLLGQKQMCCCFIYSLFVQIMYIIVNKVTFIVRENPNVYIKNNINSINTTSLSHSKNYEVKWQQSSAYSHFRVITIQYFLQKSNT